MTGHFVLSEAKNLGREPTLCAHSSSIYEKSVKEGCRYILRRSLRRKGPPRSGAPYFRTR